MVNLSQFFKKSPAPSEREGSLRVHMEEPLAVTKLSDFLARFLEEGNFLNNKPVIFCIGTDRSTGDSLGPLTGMRLATLLRGSSIPVYGTLDEPVHATNLQEYVNLIEKKWSGHPVIAIDACLGLAANVGTILADDKPLRPGAGVHKALPEVGNISFSGIVNVGGFMEFQVLQNTRLSLVYKMSHVIANSIFLGLRKNEFPGRQLQAK
ncbi:MAG: putative sporulation protein YyaC [Peptococcaceae bacterium]|nr:putative sporulation protein YyaC [Peptococcaceae bacterium]